MKEILSKKVGDLTCFEFLDFVEKVYNIRFPTMDLSEFCTTIGKNKRKVYRLIKLGHIPDYLFVEVNKEIGQTKAPMFIRSEVMKWIEAGYYQPKYRNSNSLDQEIKQHIKNLAS